MLLGVMKFSEGAAANTWFTLPLKRLAQLSCQLPGKSGSTKLDIIQQSKYKKEEVMLTNSNPFGYSLDFQLSIFVFLPFLNWERYMHGLDRLIL